MWNLVSHIKGRIHIEGVWEHGAEENIFNQERRGWCKYTQNAFTILLFAKYYYGEKIKDNEMGEHETSMEELRNYT
jgi:hypothetical protein